MKNIFLFIILVLCFVNSNLFSQSNGSITQGLGTTTVADLMPNCPSNHKTPLGKINSNDGKTWILPAENNFQTANKLTDLHNACNGIVPAALSAANLNNVPIVEIDADGEVITAFLFCDNYFELYINGVLVGVDAVPFTPFNSSVAKFKVKRPYTIAVKLVDWEENLGLGSEVNNGNNYHPGDGGFIAQFSDGTVTDETWKAQVFYIAPIQNLNDIEELSDGTHSTAKATTTPTCNSNCYGVHYPIPENWVSKEFDDKSWLKPTLYTAAQVTNQAAFKSFETTAWSNAKFIWTSNLILDNLVLVRKQVGNTTGNITLNINNNEFQIYPNPTNNEINIEFEEIPQLPMHLEIRDLYGTLLKRIDYENVEKKIQLSIDNLNSSVYFVKIYENIKKIVVNKL